MKASRWIIWLLGVYSLVMVSFVSFFIIGTGEQPAVAVIMMALGLIVFWIIIGGLVMYLLRKPVRRLFSKIPGKWQVKFVIFAVILALIEEAVTVTMTNLAPLFGSEIGVAYITASANYLHTVLFHSVIYFVPLFIAWAVMLSRYDFSVEAVFLTTGLIGTLAEVAINPSSLLGGFWFFVYGLMVFLPIYCVVGLPERKNLRKPKFWQYVLIYVITLLLVVPVGFLVNFAKGWFGIELFVS